MSGVMMIDDRAAMRTTTPTAVTMAANKFLSFRSSSSKNAGIGFNLYLYHCNAPTPCRQQQSLMDHHDALARLAVRPPVMTG